MASQHLSNSGVPASPWSTWATAAGALSTLGTSQAAGDNIYIDSTYTESAATYSFSPSSPTNANPLKVLSGTPDTVSGITALTAGAALTYTGTTCTISFAGYMYGVTFIGSSNSAHAQVYGSSDAKPLIMQSCGSYLTGTGSASDIEFGNATATGGSIVRAIDHSFKFGAAGQIVTYSGNVEIIGGSIVSGGTSPTAVFKAISTTRGARLLVVGFDFSNGATGINLHGVGQGGAVAIFRNIKVPASWSGEPITDANIRFGQRVEVWNYTDGTTRKRLWTKTLGSSVVEENTIVMSGGASDSAAYSWKMVTVASANISYTSPTKSPELFVENTTSGSSKTITVEIVHDSATALNDDEIWLEVETVASSSAIGVNGNDAKASVLASAAAQTSSSVTWTTTGLSNPNKQKLAVTLTPAGTGTFIGRVCMAVANKTVYINPQLIVT